MCFEHLTGFFSFAIGCTVDSKPFEPPVCNGGKTLAEVDCRASIEVASVPFGISRNEEASVFSSFVFGRLRRKDDSSGTSASKVLLGSDMGGCAEEVLGLAKASSIDT